MSSCALGAMLIFGIVLGVVGLIHVIPDVIDIIKEKRANKKKSPLHDMADNDK